MKIDKNISKGLGQSAFVMSTIGGGTVAPSIEVVSSVEDETHYIRVPSVHPRELNVEMDEKYIYVYQQIELEHQLEIPYLIHSIEMPYRTDVAQVNAEYNNDELWISIPHQGSRV